MGTRDTSAVVLAAGEGRRLEPLTNTRPKPMLPVANRPILDHVVGALAEAGIDHVVLVVGYRRERIRNHFGDGEDWDVDVEYVVQSPQLGTGHAVLQAADAVDGPFLVLNGDRIVEPSIIEDVRATAAETGDPVVSITHVEHPSTFGVVEVSGGRLVDIEEEPLDPEPRELINAGVYAFDADVFETIEAADPIDGEIALTATLNRLAERDRVRTVAYDGTWLDVTHLWDLPAVNAIRIRQSNPPSATAVDADRARLSDPVVLGSNVHVGAGSALRNGVAVGEHAWIGSGATIEHAVVMPDATVDAGAVIRHAVVGANATIGPNVTIEGGDATVVVDDAVHRNVELGAVVGDNATVGGGVTFAPGTVLGNDATVASGVTLAGRIDPGVEVHRG